MRTYHEMWSKIYDFAKEKDIPIHEIARVSREMATCDKCKYYCQHYDVDGTYVPFGHCNRLNNRARKPHEASCSNWEYREEVEK